MHLDEAIPHASKGGSTLLRAYQANAKDSEGVEYFWAYDITNTDFAKQLGYTEKVYLAFPGQSDSNKENAERFLIYLFKLAE